MFFGLCNSPATFQTMMNDILHKFIDWGEVICYMDDILIYSSTLSEHQQIMELSTDLGGIPLISMGLH